MSPRGSGRGGRGGNHGGFNNDHTHHNPHRQRQNDHNNHNPGNSWARGPGVKKRRHNPNYSDNRPTRSNSDSGRSRNRNGNNNGYNQNFYQAQSLLLACVRELLMEPNRGAKTLKELISVTAVSLKWHWRMREREGMTEQDIIRDLGLPLSACKTLGELTGRAMEGVLGPDRDGDLPMLDTDGGVPNGQVINANLTEPRAVVWDSFERFLLGG
ncbi:hypothetical protein C8A03DRAFT_32273 [Achaetomium macrosporum]|uniref:Uncharacterized protein n=1 Tax=Achaetomium macrosporum TaxID=79813 RepID=A0AAN7HCF1_9PEZI|nr:hypothetical protein C8A03DRAFT_32273 [Achaetomium macrosporum]